MKNTIFFGYDGKLRSYRLTVNDYTVLLHANDIQTISNFVNMEGISGHLPLRDWFKKNEPKFFEDVIKSSKKDNIVVEILKIFQQSLYFRKGEKEK